LPATTARTTQHCATAPAVIREPDFQAGRLVKNIVNNWAAFAGLSFIFALDLP